MTSKVPKKKESKDVVTSVKDGTATSIHEESHSARRKTPIPLWPEWNDQDVTNEKWDSGKKEKDRGRSPTANFYYFEDPEGRIELPVSLKYRCKYWKRPTDILENKIGHIICSEAVNATSMDLLTANSHLIDSELIRHIIGAITTVYNICGTPSQIEDSLGTSMIKIKPSTLIKDTKVEKGKKEQDNIDVLWKPWDLIWPKENPRANSLPIINSYGKYAVKIFWMGCHRKIIVDDSIPCDDNMVPLLPFTARENELWPLLVTKALIKVASLDYLGGRNNSEFGDVDFIHCLTGWLPEPIPLEKIYNKDVWQLLLKLLPHWKLPQPTPPADDDMKVLSGDEEVVTELDLKESKETKVKKEEKKEEKKLKPPDRSDTKTAKEKVASAHPSNKSLEPEVVVFASFSNPPLHPCKISHLKEMADSSEKLRKFGLSHYLPHSVYVTTIRDCPLVPPPIPVPIPRWKLIRQKKKKELFEPSLRSTQEKPPKFLELKSPFFNYKVSPVPLTGSISPLKWDKFKPPTPLESVCEEEQNNKSSVDEKVNNTSVEQLQINDSNEIVLNIQESVSERAGSAKKISIVSVANSPRASPSKNDIKDKKRAKSSKDGRRKSILKESKSTNQESKIVVPDITTTDDNIPEDEINLENTVIPDILENSEQCLIETEETIKDLWMDYDEFCQCFETLWVYHKPKTYNKIAVDTKCPDPRFDKSKKTSSHNATPAGRNTLSPTTSSIMATVSNTDSLSPFFLVDCLKETELVVSFQSFSSWFDPYKLKEEENGGENSIRPIDGSLIIEPYTCKKIITPNPLLRIKTTGIKSAVVTLQPGRHVLHFLINAPLGYHLCLCSSENFIFGDENLMMQHLTKESGRFIEHALSVMKCIENTILSFHDFNIPRKCDFIIGTENRSNDVRESHFEELFKSFLKVIKIELGDNYTPAMDFSLKALKYEIYLRLKKYTSIRSKQRPTSLTLPQRKFSIESPNIHVKFSVPDITMLLPNKEEHAATRIQATFKGYYERKLQRAHLIGTKENSLVSETLTKLWNHIESNVESVAIQTYRTMFKEKPSLFSLLFTFHADEWNKIVYTDYTGSYVEQPPETWFVICREIFQVGEPLLLMCKFFCIIPSCILKVINNDTGEEIKTLFTNIIPQVLQKNKLGYTFVALASSGITSTPAGKYRLRIIADKDPLPYPMRESVNSSFVIKDIRDYYVPNRYNRVFKYSVNVTEDILTSIYVNTFKEDVLIKLQVVDNGEVMYTCEGKSQVILPAVLFYRDRYVQDETKKTSRPSSQTGSIRSSSKVSSTKRPISSSRKSASPDKNKRKSNNAMRMNENEIVEDKVHKYIIEGYVLRDSWPLTKTEWNFIETLSKPNEKNEDEAEPIIKPEVSGKNSAGKSRKQGGGKDSKANRSRPESQTQNTFDTTKSNWLLQCIVDSTMEQGIVIRRDTQREDEIKAIKAAWESVEPGRLEKARETRRKYLETHTVNTAPVKEQVTEPCENLVKDEETSDENIKAEEIEINVTEITSSPVPTVIEEDNGELFLLPPVKDTDIVLKPFDVTPFIRSTGKRVVLDENEEERIRCSRELKFNQFHNARELILSMRENDRLYRNIEKEEQLKKYEEMQLKLDEARHELHKVRLNYRNKFIEQPEVEIHEVESTNERSKKRTPSPKRKPSKAVKSASRTKKK